MRDIQIRPITSGDTEGFHSCLDSVSRERKHLAFRRAPPLEHTRKWLEESMRRGEIRFLADALSAIVGWCDIEVSAREGFEHSGRLGMGVLREYRGQGTDDIIVIALLFDE